MINRGDSLGRSNSLEVGDNGVESDNTILYTYMKPSVNMQNIF